MDAVLSSTPLIPADGIERRIREMAAEIRRETPGPLHIVAVLKGAFIFLADLVRQLGGEVTIDFISLSSYGASTTSSGTVRLVNDIEAAIDGRDILVVEDIVDSGVTLAFLLETLRARQPRTLRTACLLSKPSRREVQVAVEYVGFTLDDQFVVGYGLDLAERYRNLPHIFTIAPESAPR